VEGGEEETPNPRPAPPQQLREEDVGRTPPPQSPAAEGAAPHQSRSTRGERRRSPKTPVSLADLTTTTGDSTRLQWEQESKRRRTP